MLSKLKWLPPCHPGYAIDRLIIDHRHRSSVIRTTDYRSSSIYAQLTEFYSTDYYLLTYLLHGVESFLRS